MAKGKRPAKAPGMVWARWVGVLVGLAIVAGVVWWVATRAAGEPTAPEEAASEPGQGPAPLDLEGGGPTVEEASIANVPPESLVAAGPDTPRGVNVSSDPRLGASDAPVVIVEFSDFQCPFCASFHLQTFPALRSLYGDRVRWYFVNRFFNPPHTHAERAALAAECAHRQGRFWEYADQVFQRQAQLGPDLLDQIASQLGLDRARLQQCMADPAIAAEVAADQAEADRVKVQGTPTFFVNGQRIEGAQPVGVFNQLIAPYFQR